MAIVIDKPVKAAAQDGDRGGGISGPATSSHFRQGCEATSRMRMDTAMKYHAGTFNGRYAVVQQSCFSFAATV
jgi:hypothetical protein